MMERTPESLASAQASRLLGDEKKNLTHEIEEMTVADSKAIAPKQQATSGTDGTRAPTSGQSMSPGHRKSLKFIFSIISTIGVISLVLGSMAICLSLAVLAFLWHGGNRAYQDQETGQLWQLLATAKNGPTQLVTACTVVI